MAVHCLERGKQALTPLAIERPDRTAQAVDGGLQFGDFGRALRSLALQLGEFAFGDQVDGADSLSFGDQAVVASAFVLRVADFARVEARAFGEQRRRTLEPFAGNAAHLDPAQVLALGTGGSACPRFPGGGERFGSPARLRLGIAQRGFGGPLGGGACGRTGHGFARAAVGVALLRQQRGGPPGQPQPLGLPLGRALVEFGDPLGRLPRAHAPAFRLGLRKGTTLAVEGEAAV